MPIILTSIDRYGSVMLVEYTTVHGKMDHWDCEIIAERMKSERIDLLFTDIVIPKVNRRKLSEEAAALRPQIKVLFMTAIRRTRSFTKEALMPRFSSSTSHSIDALALKVRAILDR
jgi:two-component SAPR family response regulator